MRLIRSTKHRKKGCAYDPGALNKQGVLKNQTLRYTQTLFMIFVVFCRVSIVLPLVTEVGASSPAVD